LQPLAALVHERASHACEYCKLPKRAIEASFQIDHIIAQQHQGQTVESNLALACPFCNGFKGPNLSGLDPKTGELIRLFHPRLDRWEEHFRWDGGRIVGTTAIGRTTASLLNMNASALVEMRRIYILLGYIVIPEKKADAD
jgi:hypothetical protein